MSKFRIVGAVNLGHPAVKAMVEEGGRIMNLAEAQREMAASRSARNAGGKVLTSPPVQDVAAKATIGSGTHPRDVKNYDGGARSGLSRAVDAVIDRMHKTAGPPGR